MGMQATEKKWGVLLEDCKSSLFQQNISGFFSKKIMPLQEYFCQTKHFVAL